MLDTGKVAAAALTTRIAQRGRSAFASLCDSKMTVSRRDRADAQLAEWAAIS